MKKFSNYLHCVVLIRRQCLATGHARQNPQSSPAAPCSRWKIRRTTAPDSLQVSTAKTQRYQYKASRIVNFWGHLCAPCYVEIPCHRVQQKYEAKASRSSAFLCEEAVRCRLPHKERFNVKRPETPMIIPSSSATTSRRQIRRTLSATPTSFLISRDGKSSKNSGV